MSVYENEFVSVELAHNLEIGQIVFMVEDDDMMGVVDFLDFNSMDFAQIISEVERADNGGTMVFTIWDNVVDEAVTVQVNDDQLFIVRK